MRTLALDHGTVRCGAAICDPSGTIVRPLEVISPPLPERIAALIAETGAERVVVGLPITPSGVEGAQARLVREFVVALQELVAVEVETWDERLTTKLAAASAGGGARAALDSLAAAHLLESYLERRSPNNE